MRVAMLSSHAQEEVEAPSVFDSPLSPADPVLLARLRDGTADADLAAPPVVLPDFCHKPQSEMPSSIAVATRGAIRPTLTDSALNCGMALATLDVPRPSERAVSEFYRRVRDKFPNPPGWKPELTRGEVLRAAVEGADFAAERYGIERAELDRVEEFGRIPVEELGGAERARKELPWVCVAAGPAALRSRSARAPISSSCRRWRRSSIRTRPSGSASTRARSPSSSTTAAACSPVRSARCMPAASPRRGCCGWRWPRRSR